MELFQIVYWFKSKESIEPFLFKYFGQVDWCLTHFVNMFSYVSDDLYFEDWQNHAKPTLASFSNHRLHVYLPLLGRDIHFQGVAQQTTYYV